MRITTKTDRQTERQAEAEALALAQAVQAHRFKQAVKVLPCAKPQAQCIV